MTFSANRVAVIATLLASGGALALGGGPAAADRLASAPAGVTISEFYGVSCTSPTACTAVGSSSRRGVAATVAERWNGTKWTIQRAPKPTGAIAAVLDGVSCTSPRACTAVGSSNYARSLAESWNGKKWTIQRTPRPSGAVYRLMFLNSVSCTSRTACTAVGESETGLPYKGKNITYLALAERWNGRKWAVQRTPRPAAPAQTFFYGALCTSRTACAAVGYTFPTDTISVVLVQRWNGAKWTVQRAPSPSGGVPAELSSVSCTSPTACTAVGDAYPEGFSLLAERWNGAAWTIQSVPRPAGQFYASLYGVSCASLTACIAVGQANNGDGSTQALLAEKWNGSTWTIQRTPAP